MNPKDAMAIVTGGLVQMRSQMATGSKLASDCDTVLSAAWQVDTWLVGLLSENQSLRRVLGMMEGVDDGSA